MCRRLLNIAVCIRICTTSVRAVLHRGARLASVTPPKVAFLPLSAEVNYLTITIRHAGQMAAVCTLTRDDVKPKRWTSSGALTRNAHGSMLTGG
ncbi:hypothetical protein BD626DRAFT_504080 [Schizophyllum amplum]|uniref:Secreted protein n=1 Tax=Schizophyllum amplum TaxID=97359 RepID=A0A550C7R0_9AGAR|nr:hypothetical protein BD626DRAFT_504080 [Auriculariopsis ampla]